MADNANGGPAILPQKGGSAGSGQPGGPPMAGGMNPMMMGGGQMNPMMVMMQQRWGGTRGFILCVFCSKLALRSGMVI